MDHFKDCLGILAFIALLIIVVIFSTGCSSSQAFFKNRQTAPLATALPDVKEYSADWMAELRTEQPKVRACCPRTNEAMHDYSKLRDKLRVQETPRRCGLLGRKC